MNSKDYWDKSIIEWENSMRGQRVDSFIEKLAAPFRIFVKHRAEMCLNILKPFAEGRRVLDLGCGSAFFDFLLYDQAKPKHITGIDISGNAVQRARAMAEARNLTEKFTFIEADGAITGIPEADITVGLGFLDYLTLVEVKKIFNNVKSQYFLFSFCEPRFSLLRYVHILYLLFQRCPKHFYYTKAEIQGCIPDKFDKIHFINDKKLSFACIVHNLHL